MKLRGLTLSLLALGGCSSSASTPPWSMAGPPTGTADRPLLDVCDLGQAFLLEQFRFSCGLGFPPSVRNTEFWAERPCLSVLTKPDGTEILRTDLTTDVTAEPTDPKARLDDELRLLFGGTVRAITYQESADGRLDGVTVTVPGAQPVSYEYRYEGERRVSEGRVGADGTYQPRYFYVYDDSGRLIREGVRAADGNAPPPPTAEVVTACQQPSSCGSTCLEAFLCADLPTVPPPPLGADDFASSVARATYFYDGDRIENVIVAAAAGFKFGRVDYVYEGDQLRSVSGGLPDSTEPTSRPRRQTLTYSCGGQEE